jgi:hypothetical protein
MEQPPNAIPEPNPKLIVFLTQGNNTNCSACEQKRFRVTHYSCMELDDAFPQYSRGHWVLWEEKLCKRCQHSTPQYYVDQKTLLNIGPRELKEMLMSVEHVDIKNTAIYQQLQDF